MQNLRRRFLSFSILACALFAFAGAVQAGTAACSQKWKCMNDSGNHVAAKDSTTSSTVRSGGSAITPAMATSLCRTWCAKPTAPKGKAGCETFVKDGACSAK